MRDVMDASGEARADRGRRARRQGFDAFLAAAVGRFRELMSLST